MRARGALWQAHMETDLNYFRRRAEEELLAAQASSEPTAVRAHYLLANYYLDHIANDDSVPLDDARGMKPAIPLKP